MTKFRYHYIYKIINKLNGMEYTGVHSTNNIEDGYFGSGVYLHHAIKKYGKDNFEKQIIEYCNDRKSVLNREKEIVCIDYVRKDTVYNLVLGGASPGGRDTTIKKYPIGGFPQLLIDFSKPLQEDPYKIISKDKQLIFYANLKRIKKEKQLCDAIICAIKSKRGSNYKSSPLYFQSLFRNMINGILPIICNDLTNMWNNEYTHKYAMKIFYTFYIHGMFINLVRIKKQIAA